MEQACEWQTPPENVEDSWRGQIPQDFAHDRERIELVEAYGGLNPAALQDEASVRHEELPNGCRGLIHEAQIAVTELAAGNPIDKVLGLDQVEADLYVGKPWGRENSIRVQDFSGNSHFITHNLPHALFLAYEVTLHGNWISCSELDHPIWGNPGG